MAGKSVVYVIDDDPKILEALVVLLSSRGYSVRAFRRPDEFFSQSKPNVPACLILDLNPGDCNGLEVQRQLSGDEAMPVIFLSEIVDVPTTVVAMRAGASEFLLKPVDEGQLLSSVRAALKQAHDQWAGRELDRRIRRNYDSLTRREQEVLPYIVSGFLNKQTAYELGTSEITIRIHRGHIMRKMNASSLAELVWLASRMGIPDRTSYVEELVGTRDMEAVQ